MFTQEELKAKALQLVEVVKTKWAGLSKQNKMIVGGATAVAVLVLLIA